jgi:hypothetical protein
MELPAFAIFITVDVTGAVIYSAINPFSMSFWDEDLYEEDTDRSSKRTFINFLLATIFHSLFIFTWIGGFITTYQVMRKGKYFKVLRNDIRYLANVVDTYLLSEVEKMEDDQIDAEIERIEKLLNRYQILVHYLDRDSPYDIQYRREAKDIFRRRTQLKIKTR